MFPPILKTSLEFLLHQIVSVRGLLALQSFTISFHKQGLLYAPINYNTKASYLVVLANMSHPQYSSADQK